MKYLALLLVFLVGCGGPQSNPGKYIAFVSVYTGSIAIGETNIPAPQPVKPKDTKPENCTECNQLGWNGDGTIRKDCAFCDKNQDGDLKDPTEDLFTKEEWLEKVKKQTFDKEKAEQEAIQKQTEEAEKLKQKELETNLEKTKSPWYISIESAIDDAKELNRDIFVVLSNVEPKEAVLNSGILSYIENNFSPLYVDVKDEEVLGKWTKADPGKLSNKDTFVCLLNSDGNFLKINNQIFFSIDEDAIKFQDILNEILSRKK